MNKLIQQARELCEKAKAEKAKGNFIDCAALSWAIVKNIVPQPCDAPEAAQEEIAGLQKQIDTITGGYDYYANRSQQFENAAKEWAAENKRLTSRAEKAEAERDAANKCIYDTETYFDLGANKFAYRTIKQYTHDAAAAPKGE